MFEQEIESIAAGGSNEEIYYNLLNLTKRVIDQKGRIEGKKKVYYISKINRLDYLSNPAEILQNIKSGETVSVVFLDSVSFFDEDFINANRENAKIPEMFMTFSHIKNSLIAGLNKDFTDFNVDKIGSWTVVSCKKK